MKLGLIPVNIGVTDAAMMIGMAQKAEALGYESLWTFEHVIVPVEYESKYPYSKSGNMGAAPETPFVDPLIALATIASHTRKIRLGTGVNILSQTNPLLLAKQAASIDTLSKGRLMLGLGIGWLQEEFVAMGTPFEKRGARFDDYVDAMRKVWSGEVVEHQSEFLNWTNFKSYPTPVQSPLPIIMGGSKGKILERIVKLGNGWYVPSADASEIADMLNGLKRTCDRVGRDYDELEITVMWPGQGGADALARLQSIGVHRAVIPIPALGADPLEGMERLIEECKVQ